MDKDYGLVGYVALIGRANVGKSTYLNKILNFNLAAVCSKPHMTRNHYLGIYSSQDCQIIFIDTPGFNSNRKYLLEEKMNQELNRSLKKCDLIICLADCSRVFGEEDKEICHKIKQTKKNCLLLINKTDKPHHSHSLKEYQKSYLNYLDENKVKTIFISCLKEENLKQSIETIKNYLSKDKFIYPTDQISNIPIRNMCEEIIRETCYQLVSEEVPYSLAVIIEEFKEKDRQIKITATIYIERQGQKAIIIGSEGKKIKKIIKISQEKINKLMNKFIKLKLILKIKKDWQNNKPFLKRLGF